MIKLSGKSRRVIRAIYRGLGVTAVSLVFQACYGMPPDELLAPEYGMPPDIEREEVIVRGCVKSKKTGVPIGDISIWIKGKNYTYSTYSNGNFSLYLPKQDAYTMVFTDIDGGENGLFKQLTVNLTREEIEALDELIIELEEVDEE